MKKKVKKIVLAYSGGLDTSVILRWLQENYHAEIIAYTADLGQEIDRKKIIRNARNLGVKNIVIEDLKDVFVKDYIFPLLDNGKQVFMLLIDNLRFDQWTIIKPLIEQYFRVDNESLYYSIIPTTTQYARNAIFAGMMPNEIRNKYRNYWVDEHEEGTKNKFEQELLKEQFKRFGRTTSISYMKILNINAGRKLFENISNLMNTEFNVIVYNFVDMLSHARTEMEIIRELADNVITSATSTTS